jgi:hypothetical protein
MLRYIKLLLICILEGLVKGVVLGYWRADPNSYDIEQCTINLQQCVEDNYHHCLEGYIGPLCETCDSLMTEWNQQYF